jgi:hypothetical protein
VVTFSKPMEPAGASNVNNYGLLATSTRFHSSNRLIANAAFYSALGIVQLGPSAPTTTIQSVRFKSANYDPATHSVTLVPMRKLSYKGGVSFIVNQGTAAKSSPSKHSKPGPLLTDLEGRQIDTPGMTPGRFSVFVTSPGSSPTA